MDSLDGQPSLPTTGNRRDPQRSVPAVPEHDLLRRIGKGSYGEVWLARNQLGTLRAVKVIAWDDAASAELAEREYAGIEMFEPVSRSHEGLVDVLQVGRDESAGYFYYVMELADDRSDAPEQPLPNPEAYTPRTLAGELARRDRLPVEECVQLGMRLSDAVHHLHARGLVHRDIKPANVVFVQGMPKLADIGLVTGIDAARSYVGTMGFIPPEGPGSPQADIYSLGKVLYEISTGLDRQQFPALPQDLHAWPDAERMRELNEILLKSCHPDRAQRYATAGDLHADLVALAHGKSIKRLRWLELQFSRFKRIAATAGAISLVLAGVAFALLRERQHRAEVRQRDLGGNLADGTHAVDRGDLLGSLRPLAAAWELDDPDQEETHRLRLGTILQLAPRLTHTWSAPNQLASVQFSSDGELLLAAAKYGAVHLHPLAPSLRSPPALDPAHLLMAALDPQSRRVVTASEDMQALVWDLATGTTQQRLPHPNQVLSARFSPDGRRIVTACADGVARLWQTDTGKLEGELQQHTAVLRHALFSHDGRQIATCSQDGTALLWDAASRQVRHPPLHHESWVYHAAFSPDDRLLVTASFDRTARIWDTATGQQLPPPLEHRDGVQSAEFSPDGRWILTASLDRLVRIYDAHSRRLVPAHPEFQHPARVLHASFAPDGRRIATACFDGSARLWDLASTLLPPRELPSAAISESGHVTTWTAHTVEVFPAQAAPATAVRLLAPPGYRFETSALSPDGRHLITFATRNPPIPGELQHLLQVWHAVAARPASPPIALPQPPQHTSLSHDGQFLAISYGNTVQVFDVDSARSLTEFAPGKSVADLRFAPGSHTLLTAASTTVQLWNVFSGHLQKAIPQTHKVAAVRFSPDGSRFVTAVTDDGLFQQFAQVWYTRTGQPCGQPLAHDDGVLYAAFSPDGRRVLTASEDFTARVWDAHSGHPITAPLRHRHQVLHGAFNHNADWIVTACADRTVQVWHVPTSRPVTPPLKYPLPIGQVTFAANDTLILAAAGTNSLTRSGAALIWTLPFARQSPDDLQALASFLSGTSPDPGPGTDPNASPADRHSALRARFPAAFEVPPERIEHWHRFHLAACETQRQWTAAKFHLDQLLTLHPDASDLRERANRIRRHLQTDPHQAQDRTP